MSRFFDALHKAARVLEELPKQLPQETLVLPHLDTSGLVELQVERAHVGTESRLEAFTELHGLAADRFRLLRLHLRDAAARAKLKTLLLTSPLPEDGKSTVAMNLAITLAEGGKRSVLLLEADLHRPVLVERLRLAPWPGLAEYLESTSSFDLLSGVRRVEPLGIYLLPSGKASGNPTELLQSGKLPHLFEELARYFEWILIDATPVIPLLDAVLLKAHAEASLLVVRAGYTPREDVEEAIQRLGSGHVFGVVLNGVDGLDRRYSGYYYYSSNGSRSGEQK